MIKERRIPEDWKAKAAKLRQKDRSRPLGLMVQPTGKLSSALNRVPPLLPDEHQRSVPKTGYAQVKKPVFTHRPFRQPSIPPTLLLKG